MDKEMMKKQIDNMRYQVGEGSLTVEHLADLPLNARNVFIFRNQVSMDRWLLSQAIQS